MPNNVFHGGLLRIEVSTSFLDAMLASAPRLAPPYDKEPSILRICLENAKRDVKSVGRAYLTVNRASAELLGQNLYRWLLMAREMDTPSTRREINRRSGLLRVANRVAKVLRYNGHNVPPYVPGVSDG